MASSKRNDDTEVIRLVSRRLNLDEAAVRNMLDIVSDAVLTALAAHHNVHLKDFLGFSLHETKTRQHKNPKTGQITVIPASRNVHVTPESAFQDRAKRKLETILAVNAAESEALKTAARYLSLASYTVVESPSLAAARDILTARPVSVILAGPGTAPADVWALARFVREHPLNSLASILAVGQEPPHRGLEAGLCVLPNAWLDPALPPDDLFAQVESEIERLSEERGYFQKQIACDIPTTPDAVQAAIDFLEQILLRLPFGEEERFKLVTSFREALENALRHGNKRDPDLLIHAELLVDLEKLTLSVRDEGTGFDFASHLAAASTATALDMAQGNIARGKTGGLGIKLLRECVDEIEYLPPGNTLVLTKKLPLKTASGPGGEEPHSVS